MRSIGARKIALEGQKVESYRLWEKRKAGVFHDLGAKPVKGSSSISRKTQVEGQDEITSRYEDL